MGRKKLYEHRMHVMLGTELKELIEVDASKADVKQADVIRRILANHYGVSDTIVVSSKFESDSVGVCQACGETKDLLKGFCIACF